MRKRIKKLKIKIAAIVLLSMAGLSANVQHPMATGSDLPSGATGTTRGGIGFSPGSVNTPGYAIDGHLSTKSVRSAFFTAGSGVNWILNTKLNNQNYDGDGIADIVDADDDYFGDLSSNINITVKAFLRGAFNGTRHKDVTTTWMNILKQHAPGLINNIYRAQDINPEGTVCHNGINNDRCFLIFILSGNGSGVIRHNIKIPRSKNISAIL